MKVKVVSVDNPFFLPLIFLTVGLIGFCLLKISIGGMLVFDYMFLMGSLYILVFYYKQSNYVENANFVKPKPINPFISVIVIIIKLYLVVSMISKGSLDSFDDRLASTGSSFLIALGVGVNVLLFPIIPLLAKNKFIRFSAVSVWFVSVLSAAVLAPSKSLILNSFFSLATFYFFNRKFNSNKNYPRLGGFFWYGVAFSVAVATLAFIFLHVGVNAASILVNRIAMNFDLAIYAGQIAGSDPPHGVFYYAFLPILKQIDPAFRELEFFSIPQYVLFEALEIARYGRFGYPNDNLVVGLLLSYGYAGLVILALMVSVSARFLKYLFNQPRLGVLGIYFTLSMPRMFSSFQDFMMGWYVFLFLFVITQFIFEILPKKRSV